MTLIAIPTAETKVPTAPITFERLLDDEALTHHVRTTLDEHERDRLILQVLAHAGPDLVPAYKVMQAIIRDQRTGQFRPELHDTLSDAVRRIRQNLDEHGYCVWDFDPDHARQLEDELDEASLEPTLCADCGQAFALTNLPYCGRCDDAHTHPRSA